MVNLCLSLQECQYSQTDHPRRTNHRPCRPVPKHLAVDTDRRPAASRDVISLVDDANCREPFAGLAVRGNPCARKIHRD